MIREFSDIFFSNSPKMKKLRGLIRDVGKSDITVLIRGESGTGKELVARIIHLDSPRSEKPLIKVNCATIPKGLLESELFGFERGAFTGANLKKPGKFELANEGTILLSDIGEIHFSIQAKLLQVLQDGEFSRLGGEQSISVNTRVVTTTRDQLEQLVLEGRFREDLLYRINVMTLTLPPLRDRREQILPLTDYFFNLYREKYLKNTPALSSDTLRIFQDNPWPGNVRELENIIKRIVLFGEEGEVTEDLRCNRLGQGRKSELPESGTPGAFVRGAEMVDLKEIGKKAAETAEKEAIRHTLQETHWNRKAAATSLDVSYKALLYKIQKYRLDELERPDDLKEKRMGEEQKGNSR
jgi:two-component system, NtrC family, response regulator AtoC